jgi:hypothetical protein
MFEKRQRFCLSFAFAYALVFFIVQGCAKPNIRMPDSLPPLVKEYKHTSVSGGSPGMRSTEVYIEKGDAYTILATGSIDFWHAASAHVVHKPPPTFAYHDVRPELGWPLMLRIGESYKFSPFHGRNGVTSISHRSGTIHLGYKSGPVNAYGKPLRPDYYRDDKGVFSVDIIVWQKPDWVQIADYLSQQKLKESGNKALEDALADAEKYRSIYVVEEKAKKEIADTEKQIDQLKQESAPQKQPVTKTLPDEKVSLPEQPAPIAADKKDKIVQLEERLAKLLEVQGQLDQMKAELAEEKKKSLLLAEELGEKCLRSS